MKNKDILTLAIFTLVTVSAWIAFEVYHAATITKVTPLQKELVLPLNTDFPVDVLE